MNTLPVNQNADLISNFFVNLDTVEVSYQVSQKSESGNITAARTEKVETCDSLQVKDFIKSYISVALSNLPDTLDKSFVESELNDGKLHLALNELKLLSFQAKGLRRSDNKSFFNPTANENKTVNVFRIVQRATVGNALYTSFTIEIISKGKNFDKIELRHYSDKTKDVPLVRNYTTHETDVEIASKYRHICKLSQQYNPIEETEESFHTFYEVLVLNQASKNLNLAGNGEQKRVDWLKGEKERIKLLSKASQTTAHYVQKLDRFDRDFNKSMAKRQKISNGEKISKPAKSEKVTSPFVKVSAN